MFGLFSISLQEQMEKKRIAYIDAMRGFTMIFVVYSHICGMCLGDRWMGWNDIFFLFRLPCFFFISGWLFEKTGRQWDGATIKSVIKNKFMVQIVPTFIFLLLLAPPPLFFSRLGATKGGYWFTFALFVFFLLNIFSSWMVRKWSAKQQDVFLFVFALIVSVFAFCYDAYYNRYFSHFGWLTKGLGFVSLMTWRYYLFFYVGTFVKRHFEAFIRWTSKPVVIILVIVGFFAISQIPHSECISLVYFVFAVGGILGLTMIFTAFRYIGAYISTHPTHHFSLIIFHSFIYIGTRTLDIYLLHYFFLPRFLLVYGEQFRTYDNKLLEFFVALILALIVVGLCLIASRIIRLSPFLAKYLFGVKPSSNQ